MRNFDITKASDADLLSRFEEGRDQHAFAELVVRHRPMVLATAKRVLAGVHDAEEACQATFLALAKCLGSVRNKHAVAGWLHKTAYRCAVEIRRANVRWDKTTRLAGEEAETVRSREQPYHTSDVELGRILDEELAKLPSKLHEAIVLCDLQGLSQKTAGQQLGIAQQTVNDRVTQGRRLLRDRLVRRGVLLRFQRLLHA